MRQENIVDLFTKHADLYHIVYMDILHFDKALEASLTEVVPLIGDEKVLDAGCGSGVFTHAHMEAIRRRSLSPSHYYGFDITDVMLDRFRQNIEQENIDTVHVCQADVMNLDTLPSDWRDFDLILTSGMLEYLSREQLPQALRGLKEHLKEHGRALIFITKDTHVTNLLVRRWWKAHTYKQEEIEEALQQAGFRDITFHSFPKQYDRFNKGGFLIEAVNSV